MSKAQQQERDESLTYLRKLLRPGDTIGAIGRYDYARCHDIEAADPQSAILASMEKTDWYMTPRVIDLATGKEVKV